MSTAPIVTFAANTKIKSAEMNAELVNVFPTWQTTWTPVWSGVSASPTLGNGTLSGRYIQHGKMIIANLYLLWGSTTSTTSTGAWRFDFPVAQNTSQQIWSATGLVFDTSISSFTLAVTQPDTNTTWRALLGGTSIAGEGSPMAWATGDYFRATIIYEAA